eukprot:3471225-Rhodomonas_salina.1
MEQCGYGATATAVRACYAMPGTNLPYDTIPGDFMARSIQLPARIPQGIPAYAMSGTDDIAASVAAMRCPVLTCEIWEPGHGTGGAVGGDNDRH